MQIRVLYPICKLGPWYPQLWIPRPKSLRFHTQAWDKCKNDPLATIRGKLYVQHLHDRSLTFIAQEPLRTTGQIIDFHIALQFTYLSKVMYCLVAINGIINPTLMTQK